ncbi:MAG: UDP-N-acetylmuramate dehydrogenase [Rhodothermia bacterium]|nr:UDP-N-acetylmuramate dehydrogenase [Rhodothermia bacterium]
MTVSLQGIRQLDLEFGPDRVRRNVVLAPYTTFKIGGPTDIFFEALTVDELERSIRIARATNLNYFLLGVGANILVGDRGFRGLVIRNCARGISVDAVNGLLRAESGAIFYPDVIEAAVSAGLQGIEHYVGIPSTVGGALWQNLHFLSPPPERERTMFIEEVLESAELLTEEGDRITAGVDYFNFGYDYSILHDRRDVVLTASFRLTPGSVEQMRHTIEANLEWRAERHPPLDSEPSAGSIFQKIEGMGAGRLIDQAGLKGTRIGGAEITRRHANIMINRGGATAADVLALIFLAQQAVREKFGVELRPEISFIGDFDPPSGKESRRTEDDEPD